MICDLFLETFVGTPYVFLSIQNIKRQIVEVNSTLPVRLNEFIIVKQAIEFQLL